MMGNFIFATFITLKAVLTPVINCSSGINGINIIQLFFWAVVQSKTVVLNYHFCWITDQFFGCKCHQKFIYL